MDWPFVGRTEAVDQLRQAMNSPSPRPLLLVGEPGFGRTTVVERALADVDRSRDVVIRPRPRGSRPFVALDSLLPTRFGTQPVCRRVIDEATASILATHVGDRRPVIVADDAHRLDLASMLVLRSLHRRAGAMLVLTHPSTTAPDSIDCVRYEPGARTISLAPLTIEDVRAVLTVTLGERVHDDLVAAVHAATGGHPGRLRDLVQRGGLRAKVSIVDGLLRLAEPGRERVLMDVRDRDRLLAAVRCAWSDLALGRLTELCKLACWTGAQSQVAVVHAEALAFSGDVEGAARLLDNARGTGEPARVAFLRALVRTMATGTCAAGDLLDQWPSDEVSRAQAAWLYAAAGAVVAASSLVADEVSDREAAVFRQAAVALIAREREGCAAAVGPLRKALVLAEAWGELPWLAPYLRAQLIDALLLGGRAGEATAMAAAFHAGAPAAGWTLAVSLALALPAARS